MRFVGAPKLGFIPVGGFPAGPLRSSCNATCDCAGVDGVEVLAIVLQPERVKRHSLSFELKMVRVTEATNVKFHNKMIQKS